MTLDLLIPFGILIALSVYLVYSRTRFEKDIVDLYEEKFKEWKENSEDTKAKEKKVCKELVALVYKQEHKLSIELLDNSIKNRLERGKFSIKGK